MFSKIYNLTLNKFDSKDNKNNKDNIYTAYPKNKEYKPFLFIDIDLYGIENKNYKTQEHYLKNNIPYYFIDDKETRL
jgi:hypothetical protein